MAARFGTTSAYTDPMFARRLLPLVFLAAAGCAGSPDADEPSDGTADALATIGAEPTGKASVHAIVLAHGFNASDTNSWAFKWIPEALARDGHVVHAARVQPYRGVADRARELARHVDAARAECAARAGCDPRKVHLVAHSMGGLDARYVVSKLANPEGVPYRDLVASVTTISTPHRGSAVGDAILGALPDVAAPAVNALAGLWARTFTDADLAADSDLRAALHDLGEANAPAFNAAVIDAPGVVYQSWAGVSSYASLTIDARAIAACEGKVESYQGRADRVYDHDPIAAAQLELLMPITGHGIGADAEPNDAMVTVASAKWGRFRGCIPADHMDEVGERWNGDGPALWSRFDPVRFYRRLAYELDAVSGAR